MANANKTTQQLWLALKFVPRLNVQKKIALADEVGLQKLFSGNFALSSLGLTQNQANAIIQPNWQRIDQIIEQSRLCQSEIITFDDQHYPQLLKEIYDPPLILFAKGNIRLFNSHQLAVVGSRYASVGGRENAQRFSKQLAQAGLTITSGLALGIDAYAHKGALSSGKTVAVVATGLDRVYPSRHKALVKSLLDAGGLIVSEFPPGTLPKPGHFPKRNRIISGMSLGVLVVEATIKSGSLITARCAIEQNREVFAIPGSVANEQVKGCHWLIKQGAKLVDCSADIIEELESMSISGLHFNYQQNFEGVATDKIVKSEKQDLCIDSLLASVGYEITPIDAVVSRSKLPTDVVLTRLMMLELQGLVSAVPGGYLRLK
ncbi:DNA-processing protein DprA [Thalassotalea sp. PLHSN55]|uniref:DNA-processing protein DprA n=1 Tax=Thalassotalea sp. PLHSN55 TaxID=3435888 RepID=UPI003F84449C